MASNTSGSLFVGGSTQGVVYISGWDASAGTFPGGGAAQGGHLYKTTVAGTVDGVAFGVGDSIIAANANASTTTYLGNWNKIPQSSDVASVFGRIGIVTGATDDLTDVDTTTVPPVTDNVLKFDGTNWVPGQSSAGIADWVTGTAYKDGQYVWVHAELYKASLDHTAAATFEIDLVANNWDPISPTARSWVAAQPVRQGDVQVVNMGGVSVYLAAVASRLTGATFDATEASEWQYIGQAGPGTYVTNQAVVSGFLFKHTDGTVYRRIASGTNTAAFTTLFEEDNWEVVGSGSFRGPYSGSAAYNAGDIVVYQHDLYRSNFARTSGSWGAAPNIGDGGDKFTRMGRIKTFNGNHAYAIGDLVYDATGGNLGSAQGIYKVTAAIAALSAPDFDNAVAIATAPIYRGQYGAAKYSIGDVVEQAGKLYRCLVAHGSNNFVGPFTPANWVEIAATTPTQRLAATQASLAPGNYDLDSSGAAFDITLQDVVGIWNFYNTNRSISTNAVTLKSPAAQTFTDATGTQIDADFVMNLPKAVTVLHTETGDSYRVSIDDAIVAPTTFTPNGAWNAATNTPNMNTPTNRVSGSTYYVYYISSSGTVDLGLGSILFEAGGRIEWFSSTVYNYQGPGSAVPLASDTVAGRVELAIDAEAEAGTAADKALTPANAAAAYIKKSLVDAKGDVLVGSANNTLVRVAVGTNGQTIVADSAEVSGVKWSDLPKITDWATATAYAVGDYVNESNKLYKVLVSHTSDTLIIDDVLAGNVTEVSRTQVKTNLLNASLLLPAATGSGETYFFEVGTASPIFITATASTVGGVASYPASELGSGTKFMVNDSAAGAWDVSVIGEIPVEESGAYLLKAECDDVANGSAFNFSSIIESQSIGTSGVTVSGTNITLAAGARYRLASWVRADDAADGIGTIGPAWEFRVGGIAVGSNGREAPSAVGEVAGGYPAVAYIDATGGSVIVQCVKTTSGGTTPDFIVFLEIQKIPSGSIVNPGSVAVNDQGSSGYFDIGSIRYQFLTSFNAVDQDVITLPAAFASSTYSISLTNHGVGRTLVAATTVTPTSFMLRKMVSSDNTSFDATASRVSVIAMGLKP